MQYIRRREALRRKFEWLHCILRGAKRRGENFGLFTWDSMVFPENQLTGFQKPLTCMDLLANSNSQDYALIVPSGMNHILGLISNIRSANLLVTDL